MIVGQMVSSDAFILPYNINDQSYLTVTIKLPESEAAYVGGNGHTRFLMVYNDRQKAEEHFREYIEDGQVELRALGQASLTPILADLIPVTGPLGIALNMCWEDGQLSWTELQLTYGEQ